MQLRQPLRPFINIETNIAATKPELKAPLPPAALNRPEILDAMFQKNQIGKKMSIKKQAIRHTMEFDETAHEIAQPLTAEEQLPTNLGSSLNSVVKILRWCRTAYRLGAERYRQRKQLMEMDYHQLKDIGISPEQAEQEGRKPIWKG